MQPGRGKSSSRGVDPVSELRGKRRNKGEAFASYGDSGDQRVEKKKAKHHNLMSRRSTFHSVEGTCLREKPPRLHRSPGGQGGSTTKGKRIED